MRVARDEIRHWVDFDHVVVNEDLPTATETVRAVLHCWPVDDLAHDRASRLYLGIGLITASTDLGERWPPPGRTGVY